MTVCTMNKESLVVLSRRFEGKSYTVTPPLVRASWGFVLGDKLAADGQCGALHGPTGRAGVDRGCVKTCVNFELGGRPTPPHHERIAYSAI